MFEDLPLEIQYLIFGYITPKDYKMVLQLFPTFSSYLSDTKKKYRCHLCRVAFAVKTEAKWCQFCKFCEKGLCKDCICLHAYSYYLIDCQDSYYVCIDCNPFWWQPFFKDSPQRHHSLFCENFVDCMFANVRLPIWNQDQIQSHSTEPSQEHYILIQPKGSKTVIVDDKEWYLPSEHNLWLEYFTDILKLERYCDNRDMKIGRDYKIIFSTGKK